MKLIVRKKQTFEVFESPKDEGLGVEVASLKDGTLGLKVTCSNQDKKRDIGFIPLAKGSLDEAESLEGLVSLAVESPEFGGSSLEYLALGDQVIYDRYGDGVSAEEAWRSREGYRTDAGIRYMADKKGNLKKADSKEISDIGGTYAYMQMSSYRMGEE